MSPLLTVIYYPWGVA
uniref:Uncharacterized protein n=1 Tax=Arundo donax TaxID=35708 RepID=A0A0A9C7C9_ARUDO